MNKDIEDALEQIHIKLRQVGNELEAIGTQYKLSDIEADALEQINNDLQNSIREIERLTI